MVASVPSIANHRALPDVQPSQFLGNPPAQNDIVLFGPAGFFPCPATLWGQQFGQQKGGGLNQNSFFLQYTGKGPEQSVIMRMAHAGDNGNSLGVRAHIAENPRLADRAKHNGLGYCISLEKIDQPPYLSQMHPFDGRHFGLQRRIGFLQKSRGKNLVPAASGFAGKN